MWNRYDAELVTKIAVLIGCETHAVLVHDDVIFIEIKKALTFEKLTELSKMLGTDKIDIRPAEPARYYSEQSYDEGTPATIMVYAP